MIIENALAILEKLDLTIPPQDMKISQEEVTRIAALAQLDLDPREQVEMVRHLRTVLKYVEKLDAVQLEGMIDDRDPTRPEQASREDQIGDCLSPKEALGNARKKSGGYFSVPKVI